MNLNLGNYSWSKKGLSLSNDIKISVGGQVKKAVAYRRFSIAGFFLAIRQFFVGRGNSDKKYSWAKLTSPQQGVSSGWVKLNQLSKAYFQLEDVGVKDKDRFEAIQFWGGHGDSNIKLKLLTDKIEISFTNGEGKLDVDFRSIQQHVLVANLQKINTEDAFFKDAKIIHEGSSLIFEYAIEGEKFQKKLDLSAENFDTDLQNIKDFYAKVKKINVEEEFFKKAAVTREGNCLKFEYTLGVHKFEKKLDLSAENFDTDLQNIKDFHAKVKKINVEEEFFKEAAVTREGNCLKFEYVLGVHKFEKKLDLNAESFDTDLQKIKDLHAKIKKVDGEEFFKEAKKVVRCFGEAQQLEFQYKLGECDLSKSLDFGSANFDSDLEKLKKFYGNIKKIDVEEAFFKNAKVDSESDENGSNDLTILEFEYKKEKPFGFRKKIDLNAENFEKELLEVSTLHHNLELLGNATQEPFFLVVKIERKVKQNDLTFKYQDDSFQVDPYDPNMKDQLNSVKDHYDEFLKKNETTIERRDSGFALKTKWGGLNVPQDEKCFKTSMDLIELLSSFERFNPKIILEENKITLKLSFGTFVCDLSNNNPEKWLKELSSFLSCMGDNYRLFMGMEYLLKKGVPIKNLEIVGSFEAPLWKMSFAFEDGFSHSITSKKPPKNLAFWEFCAAFAKKENSEIDQEVKNLCLEVCKDAFEARLLCFLMHEKFCKLGKEENTVSAFHEQYFGHSKSLMQSSTLYLQRLGELLNKKREGLNLKNIELLIKNIADEDVAFFDEKATNFLLKWIGTELNKTVVNEFKVPLLNLMATLMGMQAEERKECILALVKNLSKKEKETNLIFYFLTFLPQEEKISLLKELFKDPEQVKKALFYNCYFGKVNVQQASTPIYINSYEVVNGVINALNPNHLQQQSEFSKTLAQAFLKKENVAYQTNFLMQEFVVEENDRVIGRTVVKSGEHAYKVLKKGEKIESLEQEKKVLEIFNQHKQLSSALPVPKEIGKVESLSLKGRVQLELAEEPYIYAFTAPEKYYDYLQHVEDDQEYGKAREKWLRDSLYLLQEGWFHESTPLYHNQQQGRPYLFMPGLLRASTGRETCAGRLDTPRLYNQFPNVGATGIRDVGDLKDVNAIAKNPKLFSEKDLTLKFPEYFRDEQIRKNMLIANFIGTHRLIDTLLLAMRFENKKDFNWDWTNEESRKIFAEEGIKGMAMLLQAYSGYDYEKCYELAKNSTVDWDQWAKEILFWWRTDQKDPYTNYVNKNRLPENFYPNGQSVNITSTENYFPGFGFCKKEKVLEIFEKRKEENENYTLEDLRKDPEAKLYLDLGAYNSSFLLHTLEMDGHMSTALALILKEIQDSEK